VWIGDPLRIDLSLQNSLLGFLVGVAVGGPGMSNEMILTCSGLNVRNISL
jgi:hypothetical protein